MHADATVVDDVVNVLEMDEEMEETMDEKAAVDVNTNNNAPLIPIHHSIVILTGHVGTPVSSATIPMRDTNTMPPLKIKWKDPRITVNDSSGAETVNLT